jgi:hypothetical protein
MSSLARFALLLQLIVFATPVSVIFLAWMAFHLMIVVSASIDYTPSVTDPLRWFLPIVGIITFAALGSFWLISITALRKDRGALRRVRSRHWITACSGAAVSLAALVSHFLPASEPYSEPAMFRESFEPFGWGLILILPLGLMWLERPHE